MLQEDKEAIIGVIAGRSDRTAARCPNGRPHRHGDIDSRVRLVGNAGPHLASGDESWNVERPMRWDRGPTLEVPQQTRQRGANGNSAHRGSGVFGTRYRSPAPRDGWRFDPQHLSQFLVIRFRAIERRGQLLHSTVLLAETP